MSHLFQTKSLIFNQLIPYVDIQIPNDQVSFITGESGCGKSTLLKLFTAILSPSSGDILYCGQNIQTIDTIQLRREVSLVSQDVFLFDTSIKNNFQQFYQFRGIPAPSDQEIVRYLSLCCLDSSLDKHTTILSGGERQRLYLALFLSFKPKVLLLDEPSSALDHKTGNMVMDNIISFCKKHQMQLVVVSHDYTVIESFSEHTIELKRQVC